MIAHSHSLIINADDFGYNDAITQGILKGYREGVVTSTSAMVNIPGAPKRIVDAHASNPALPIGLHLNLTIGHPVLPVGRVPHLVGSDGVFLPYEAYLPCGLNIPIDEVRAEAFAQAEVLMQSGVMFDHIDYHQHILALSSLLFGVVEQLAREYHVPVRQPNVKVLSGRFIIRNRHDIGHVLKGVASAVYRNPRCMADLLPFIYSYPKQKWAAQSLGAPNWLITAFFGEPTLANFFAILHQLPPGLSELMVHPALGTTELLTMEEDYRAERYRELEVLLDPRARAEIGRLAIRLTDYSAVIHPYRLTGRSDVIQ